jgi:hypothetical protein
MALLSRTDPLTGKQEQQMFNSGLLDDLCLTSRCTSPATWSTPSASTACRLPTAAAMGGRLRSTVPRPGPIGSPAGVNNNQCSAPRHPPAHPPRWRSCATKASASTMTRNSSEAIATLASSSLTTRMRTRMTPPLRLRMTNQWNPRSPSIAGCGTDGGHRAPVGARRP